MKSCKRISKRALAILLSLLILATNVGVLPIVAAESDGSHSHAEPQDNVWSGTTGSLVAGNYELNKYEEAILVCTGLIGDTYSVAVPDSTNDGLVSINADAQTVTAIPYETNGFVWVPTAAVIKYTAADGSAGADVSVPLTKIGESYVGNYTKPANSYRIEVTYSLYIPVDAALQQALLSAPYYLVDGYDLVSSAIDGSLALVASTMNEKMEELRQMTAGSKYDISYNGSVVYSYTTPALPNGDVKTALNDLLADYDANGGTLTLAKYCTEYQRASSKTQFVIEKAEEFKEHIKWFYSRINAIGGDAGRAELTAFADSLSASVADAIEEAVQVVINKAVDKAAETGSEIGMTLDWSSLKGKTRENDAIYNELDAKRAEIESAAKKIDDIAKLYEQMGKVDLAQQKRDEAAEVRSTGFEALDAIESAITTVYTEGDAAIAEAEAKAEEAKQVIEYLPSVVSAVRTINRQKWDFIGKNLVKDSITADEYKALDKAVFAAYDSGEDISEYDDVEILDELFATSTVISAMVDQYSVFVDVKANVVAKNAVDTTSTVALNVFSTNFPMDKNTAAADVLAAIDACGVEGTALRTWDSYYNVGATYYDRVVTITDGAGNVIELGDLTGDVHVTITYVPKTYTIFETDKPAGENATVVPYGYNWRLPRPAELTKSYDYEIDGVSHRENTIVRIVKNIQVSRTEGKAIAAKTLAEVIASSVVPGATLSAKEKAVLTSGALLVDTLFFRTPDSNDKLTAVTAEGNVYTLTAQSMSAGLLNSDAAWVPVSAYPVLANGAGASFTVSANADGAYVGSFVCDELFTSVQVVYQLQIADLDATLVSNLVNLAGVLSADVADQKATLDGLCKENNFYNNLGRVNSTLLGTVTGQVTLSAAGKAALKEMTDLAINPNTGNTFLYDYLTQYMSENGGMSYYYKGENAANIRKQIALVNKNLPIIWNDPAVQKYLADMGMESEGARVEIIMAQLNSVNLKPVNALVNTNSAFIDNLLAVVTGEGTTSDHGAVSGTIVMEQVLSAAAPGQSSYGVEIQVLNKNNGVVESYKTEAFAKVGTDISAADLREMYESLLATIPNTQYYVAEIDLPATAVRLGENGLKYIGSLRPVSYVVKIDGEADQVLYAFDAYTITLPGTGDNGMKYIYFIGGSKVEVSAGATENFALGTSIEAIEALFGTDRELVITRELIDVNKANLLTFIDKMNVALGNSGLSSNNQLTMPLIPVTDADGNLSVVWRVSGEMGALNPSVFASEMMNIIESLSYVGLNGSPLFGINADGELKLHMQTLINMQVNSGFGLDALSGMIKANGDIRELNLNGASDKIVLENGMVIHKANQLGGQMMVSTLQYGVNVNNCTSVPFYVTYQDFDSQREMLAQVKKGADQLLPYVNVNCKDGALNTIVNIPDSAYAYILTSLLAVGQVRFDNLQSYDLTKVMQYAFGLITPMYQHDNISADSFFNTMKKTGFYDAIAGFNVEDHKALMNFLYNGVDHIFDHVSQTGSSEGNKYSGVLHYDAFNMVLDQAPGMASDFTNMVAEKETGLDLPITFTLKNLSAEYEALVLDIRADGITNKYTLSRKATEAIANASDNAIITLLSDVRGDIVVNGDVLLNLNGYTINGDVNAKGRLTIVDSTLDTKKCGSITGEMSGNLNIAAGKYADDVSAYLEDGYYFENNVVSTGVYQLDKNGDDLDVYLGTDYLSLDKSAAKVLALDLVTKLLMNYYGCSELVVDGNTLYGVDLIDITDSLRTPSVLLGKMIECIDCDGITAFASKFLADITDFGALADAIENGDALVEYSLMNSAFNPYISYIPEDDSFALNLSSAADKQYTNIRIFISDEVPVGQKAYMVKVLREMDSIITFNELGLVIGDITYANGLSFEGSAVADVTIDLTTNGYYPVVIGSILADSAKGARRTELVNAINTYLDEKGTDALQKALDKMTIAEAMSALESTRSKTFASILKGLGISAPEAVELESIYTIGRKVAGAIVDYSGLNGTSHALGGLKVSGTYSTYSMGASVSDDTYAKLTVILMTEVPTFPEEPPVEPECEHEYDTVVTAPTCTEEGYTTYTCIHCGDSYKDNFVSATNHEGTTQVVPGYDATCTEDGLTDSIVCTACGEVIKAAVVIPAPGHAPVLVPGYDATCTEDGLTDGYVCGVCGETITAQEVIPAHHTAESYEKLPTCTEEGITGASKCSVCGASIDAGTVVPALGHDAQPVGGYDATCTEPGMTPDYICSRCGEVVAKGVEIPATGHTIAVAQGTPAGCTTTGLTAGAYCPDCNHVFVAQEIIDALGHNVVIDSAVEPSCTVSGKTEGSHCSRCGEIFVAQEDIPVADHNVVIDPAVAATATSTGLTEGSHCGTCGKVLVAQKELAKLPFIHVPTVSLENADVIVGGKVDAEGHYIFLDSNPNGLKTKDFSYVNFVIDNATDYTITIANGKKIRGENDLVCTGDVVTVWATNKDGVEVEVEYTIIIMGDTNCDGKLNARDTALMKAAFVGEMSLVGDGALAADMNFDGKLNARDTAACDSKFVNWGDGYNTMTK